jgi:hypothetical protein
MDKVDASGAVATAPRRHKSPDGQGSVYKVYAADGKSVVRYRWELMVGYRPDGANVDPAVA